MLAENTFFGVDTIEYLGHIVSKGTAQLEPGKIEAIHNWETSKPVRQLRAFLGLSGYYHKFIQGYGSIATRLTNVLRKD